MVDLVKKEINIPSYVYISYISDDLLNNLRDYCYDDLISSFDLSYTGEDKSCFLKYGLEKHARDHFESGLIMSRNLLNDEKVDKCIIDLERIIQHTIKKICDIDHKFISHKSNVSVEMIGYAYYPSGSYILPHRHFPTSFVSSLYLDVNKNSSPITFSGDYDISVENSKCITHYGITEHEVAKTLLPRLMMFCDSNITITDETKRKS